VHYDWHWFWPNGTGEIGNNGIYPLDALRLQLGQSALPKRAMSLGGRYLFDDNGETPNAQLFALPRFSCFSVPFFFFRNSYSARGRTSVSTEARPVLTFLVEFLDLFGIWDIWDLGFVFFFSSLSSCPHANRV
jgi:hypothetical protein